MNFDAARIEYLADAWDNMQIVRARAEMERDAKTILARRQIYQAVQAATGVPWWLVAVIDMREGGVEHLGTRHLHNGDRLAGYTVNVPAGRPKVGHEPPFSWQESAVDSIKYQGLDKIRRWTIERALHVLEGYNGYKYSLQKPPRPSPYNWSCCSIYDPPGGPGGKVCVDHGPIEDVVDKQYGCAPFLFILAELDPSVRFAREADAPSVLPANPNASTVAKGSVIVVAGGAAGKAAAEMGLPPGLVVFLVIVAVVAVSTGTYFFENRSKAT